LRENNLRGWGWFPEAAHHCRMGGRLLIQISNSQSGSNTVIASEAKQSIPPRKERMDCFIASLLAMTTDIDPHSRGAIRPSFALLVPPSL
jgi:hypothetical protein